MNDDLMIDVRGLHHAYAHAGVVEPVLHGIDLQIRHGEFVVIMGPSGCGKTTLLNILGLILAPTRADTLHIAGTNAASLTDAGRTRLRRETLGFVFQRFNLLPTINVRRNVALPLRIRNETSAGRVDDILKRVGLTDYAHKKPAQLSAGQQQRAAIARAVVARPALLLADEPTGNLDSANAATVLDLLKHFHDEHHQTIVLITHNEELAVNADRRLVMRDGCFIDAS